MMSQYASVKIVHRGSDRFIGDVEFIGYRSRLFTKADWISNATSPYTCFFFPDFYRVMKKAMRGVDIVQVEQPYLLASTLVLTKAFNTNPLVVLDEHNVDFVMVKSKISSISPGSLLTMSTLPYIFFSENIAVRNASFILCVSDVDRELLVKLYSVPEDRVLVVPNGVNSLKFERANPVNDPALKIGYTVFFHGTMSWYPNLEAAGIIIDYIAPKIPEATFLIAGTDLPTSIIKKVKKMKNVKYLGFLENLEGWIKSSNICIAPVLRGGGTKLKVLEYAAAGKPIVATFKAVEGLPFANKMHALLFQDVGEDFINAIKRVLSDDALAEKLGSNAKQLALKFDWKEIGSNLYNKYESLLGERR